MSLAKPTPAQIKELVSLALAEDYAHQDSTSQAVVPAGAQCQAQMIARADGIVAGVEFALEAFKQCDSNITVQVLIDDGKRVGDDEVIMYICGSARGVLAAERVALNFLQQLSGVATATSVAVAAANGVAVLDTRKTVPGLRDAQKYAVVLGGGQNQRRNLSDELLLKENHFALSGLDYSATVKQAVEYADGKVVGIEAETIEQAQLALKHGASYVLLDNFHGVHLVAAVRALRKEFPKAVLEASGGYTLETLPALADAGVDRVSMGALTHSVPALDVSLLLNPTDD
ncbi:MAG: carboxylating nicotinate-nucleotide diphosphorylase [Planctomycetes bacterium]|nr:carboxylating nicotinate-nucleotide diphosphorylase [Planctomycetota bacterium]